MDSLKKEAVEYLTDKKEYSKILNALRDKYKKTGKLTGKVKLEKLTKEEGLLLGAIDHSFFGSTEGSLPIKKFIGFFCQGKFQGLDFLEIMKDYFGEEALVTKREKLEEEASLKDLYFQQLLGIVKSQEIKLWLIAALEYKKYGYNIIFRLYKEDYKELTSIIKNIDNGYNYALEIKEEYIPLAKFASEVTRNSHYFDIDSSAGKLFLSALGYLKDKKWASAESINELLLSVKIIRDEISNYTITYGLLVFDEKEELQGYKWFRREREPLLLNIYNLNSIKEIKAISNKAYIFENPTVFYELLKRNERKPATLICTSGQPNISSLILLDKLKKSGTELYYSGDFDPEGLQIADNLAYRYGANFKFLGMNVENYSKIKGDNSFAERVGKLDTVLAKELQDLVFAMKEHKTAGYQELLIDYYISKL